jgi:Tfp pilus assembly protein PilW
MRPFHSPQRSLSVRCRAAAGFTLVELMVAMTGGLFLTIIVFALSRDASRFYQRESRVANATLAGVSGFERLSADVARAGHLATPNIQTDPHVCNRPASGTPVGDLRALLVEDGITAVATTELKTAGINPKQITIAGALNTPEVLITNAIADTGEGWQLSLNLNTPAAKRLGLVAGANNSAALTSIFMSGATGRIVRVRANGKDQYAVVKDVVGTPGSAFINLMAAPQLQRLVSGGVQCGIDNLGVGYAVSVVDIVRYSIRPMVADPAYAELFKASFGSGGGPALPYEAKRAELVRVELKSDGTTEIDATREIVAEYAVDLQVNAWGATDATNPAVVAVADNGAALPQLLRGVHLRFSVRSREADRDALTHLDTTTDHYRIGLGATGGAPFARVRTFQSDIPLRNLEGSN